MMMGEDNNGFTVSHRQDRIRNHNIGQKETQKCKRVRIKGEHKRGMMILIWTVWFSYLSLTSQVESRTDESGQRREGPLLHKNENHVRFKRDLPDSDRLVTLTLGPDTGNCTPPTILDFPSDLFTQDERQHGAVLLHFIASVYIFYALAIVCDNYYVSSIEAICIDLRIPPDVGGASFMAIASSSPEFFTNVISTFIAKSDIGVGTVVGSAVFNILVICACCGFAAKEALPLDWYPLTRDSIAYMLAVVLLINVLRDGKIYIMEAVIFVLAYLVYIGVMWKNAVLKGLATRLVGGIKRKCSSTYSNLNLIDPMVAEKASLLRSDVTSQQREYDSLSNNQNQNENEEEEEYQAYGGLFVVPNGKGCVAWLDWVMGWPARFLFVFTIPDCRSPRFHKYYLLTLVICVAYIGLLTYVLTWMMTVIGHTLRVPDSVVGLTLMAAVNSIPEAVSSVVVARQGLGTMSISNSFGSNTFDILVCLGVPWVIRTSMIAKNEVNYVQIHSGGLEYSAIFLLISVPLLFTVFACNKFYLDRKVALFSLCLYGIFISLASMIELNIFSKVNLPTCPIPGE